MHIPIRARRVRYCVPAGSLNVLVFIIVLLFTGCARQLTHVEFPLALGNVWEYQGTYASKVATTTIRFPVQSHSISVDEEKAHGRGKYFLCSISIEGNLFRYIEIKKEDSKVMLCHGEKDDPLISESLRPGDRWRAAIFDREFTFVAKKMEQIKVPAGTYKAFRIDFKGVDKTEGSLWCVDKVGMAALEFRDCTDRAPRTVRLELKEFRKAEGKAKTQGS